MGHAVVLVCTLLILAVLWSAGVLLQTEQAQQRYQQHMQQQVLLHSWSRQLTVRLQAYQRALLGVVQTVQDHGPAWVQHERGTLSWFDEVYVLHPSGQWAQLAPRFSPLTQPPPYPPMPTGLQQVGQESLHHQQPRLQVHKVNQEHIQLTWAQPVRDAQGQAQTVVLATARLPHTLLLPIAADQQDFAYPAYYQLLDMHAQVIAHSPQLGTTTPTQRPDAELLLPAQQWQLQLWQSMPESAALAWWWRDGWQLLVVAGVLCGLAWYGLRCWLVRQMAAAWPQTVQTIEKQEQQAQCWSAFIAHLPEAVLLTQGPHIRLASPHIATLLGYAPGLLHNLTWPQHLLPPQASTAWLAQAQQALAQGHSYQTQVLFRKADEQLQTLHLMARPWADDPSYTLWQLSPLWTHSLPGPLDAATNTMLTDKTRWTDWLQSWWQGTAAGLPTTGCLVFADMDYFSALNEAAGRACADQVLAEVGQLLQRKLHILGPVTRLAGDKFAAALPGVGAEQGLLISQQLCQAVQAWQPECQGERHWISISIGIIAVDVQQHTLPAALRAADMACYQAKRRGRGQAALGEWTATLS